MAHGRCESIKAMKKLTQSQNKMACALDCLVTVMEKNHISLKPEDEEDTDSVMLEGVGTDNEEEMEEEMEDEDEGSNANTNDVAEVAEEGTGEKRKGKKR